MFYVLGDIHGQTGALDRALRLIEADGGADRPLYFVGDLVDRGPDSRGVIQRIIDGQDAGRDWHCTLGNHDLMFAQFVLTGRVSHPEIKSGKTWLHHRLGGVHTLASYMSENELDHPEWTSWTEAQEAGLDPSSASLRQALSDAARAAVPERHIDWITALPLMCDAPDNHLIVHAGLRPGRALAKQTRSDLTWIRDGWLDYDGPLDHRVVHGHTALDFPAHHGNRINTDGGAGYGRPLVPCAYEGGQWFTLDETGRTPLQPAA
ncbi:metallophosphoesterase [Thalassorhabdomicrobium marinisediminis]|uniref:metallophosphoesterase n=1 Tax=Thalassorhabdomicrobium marinisediminis TaxID=2170577 RepID=UPI0024908A9C|nr:metallophosphoesterase [Thalassorhabdomicrobium marinisediminis]